MAQEFVLNVVAQTKSHSELMVVIESAIFATMLVSQRVYRLSPAAGVEMVEAAIQRATERFAAQRGRD